MKLLIVLAVVALSNGAKLDRNYLPPSLAQTSGGSGNFLQAPISDPFSDSQRNFANGPSSANGFKTGNFGQNVLTPGSDIQKNYAQAGGDFVQPGNEYQGNNYQGSNYPQTAGAYNGFEGRPERAQASFERNAAILRQDSQNDGETYAYAYETENGIIAEENGVATNGVEAQGGYSYTGDDGQVYSIRYTADQNGFVAQGDHLPTPPPVPVEILKALEQNARDEAAGIYDDGSYNEAKYGSEENNGQIHNNYDNDNIYNGGNSYDSDRNNYNGDDDDTVVTNNALFRTADSGRANQAQDAINSPHETQSAFENKVNGANTAYLPPFVGQRQNNPTQAAQNQGRFRVQANVANTAYLPPFTGQRQSDSAFTAQNQGSFRTQGNQPATTAYLPPFSGRSGQNQNQGFINQGFGANGATKAYLPPVQRASQRNGNGFGRRPSFDAKNGSQY